MQFRLRSGDSVITVEVAPPVGQRRQCRVAGREREIELVYATEHNVAVLIDGQPIRAVVARDGPALAIGLRGIVHRFVPAPRDDLTARPERRASSGRLLAPMPGKVLDVLVASGDGVEVGRSLIVLEAMKMEHTLTADVDGTVAAVHVEPGSMVEGAQLLLEITPLPSGPP